MKNPNEFKLDDYEQSAEEFEKYVNALAKKNPVNAQNSELKTAVSNYLTHCRHEESSDMMILSGILRALRNWGATPEQKSENDQLYQIQSKLALLCQKQSEFNIQLQRLNGQLSALEELKDLKTRESLGFESEDEVDQRINSLALKISQNLQEGKASENPRNFQEMEKLKSLRNKAKDVQAVNEEIEAVLNEKLSVESFLKDTAEDYKSLKVREKFLLNNSNP
ncbi:unnamed protein product [Blepharisma stoltei]|uniref:Uncharacterized protein n=1 Tax=Blepharisma stoltei TaxID=1481888 RepID=A0AAU9IP98_9CILI|nr:unnamed protein product [Blepharisma stoltei]